MSNRIVALIKYTVSIGLLLILILNTDVKSLLKAIGQIDGLLFIFAVGIGSITILLRSYKWQLLLKVQEARLPLSKIVAITYMSLFFNNFAPGSIGGDVFKVHKTMHDSALKSGAISSIIMERFTGMVVLFFMVLLFGTWNLFLEKPILTSGQIWTLFFYGTAIFCIAFLCFFLLIKTHKLALFSRFTRIIRFIEDFKQSIAIHQHYKQTIIACLALSFVFFMVNTVAMYYFSISAGQHVDFLQLALAVPLIAFVGLIPVSINGMGIQEGAFFLFFDRIGIAKEPALLIALLPRIAILIFSIIGAIIFFLDVRKK